MNDIKLLFSEHVSEGGGGSSVGNPPPGSAPGTGFATGCLVQPMLALILYIWGVHWFPRVLHVQFSSCMDAVCIVLFYLYRKNKLQQPMGCGAQLASTQTGRGKCLGELSNHRAELQVYVQQLWFMTPWLTHRHRDGFWPAILLAQPPELRSKLSAKRHSAWE